MPPMTTDLFKNLQQNHPHRSYGTYTTYKTYWVYRVYRP